MSNLPTSHERYQNMRADFQILTFNLVPETKFALHESFDEVIMTGPSGITSFVKRLGYVSFTDIQSRRDRVQGHNGWDRITRFILTGRGESDVTFIRKNPSIVMQSMLIIWVLKFSGIVFLCIGDTMVRHLFFRNCSELI
jgi:hypothetical protein